MTDNRTTELREKLTERGVKYQAIGKRLTYWNRDGSDNECDDADFVADQQPNGTLVVEGLTPEQAIAATLGSGTCEFINDSDEHNPPKCSACGYETGIYDCLWLDDGSYEYDGNYCLNCGAKVVSA